MIWVMLNQRWVFKKYKNQRDIYILGTSCPFRWFNITDIIPLRPDYGSLEPKRHNVDFFFINLSFCLDYIVINFFSILLDLLHYILPYISCRAASTYFPNPLSRHPSFSSIAFDGSSRLHPVRTDLLSISSSRSSYTSASVWRGP